jgi:hypothetical protein
MVRADAGFFRLEVVSDVVHHRFGGAAASTGTSTAALLGCCAYHLKDVLPLCPFYGSALH